MEKPDKTIHLNETGINPITEYTVVGPSGVHGRGVFAKKPIPKGTIWWHGRPQDVLVINRAQYLTLTNSVMSEETIMFIRSLRTYAYYEPAIDALVFCLDDSRYVNHSPKPNSAALSTDWVFCSAALRDIQAGEEITEDYNKYPKAPWATPGKI